MKMAHKFLFISGCAFMFYIFCYDIVTASNPTVRQIPKKLNIRNTSIAWSYSCQSGECVRVKASQVENLVSLETCEMLCLLPPIWPKPKKIYANDRNASVISSELIYPVIHASEDVKKLVQKSYDIFINNLPSTSKQGDETKLYVVFNIKGDETKLHSTTNESYNLRINRLESNVQASIMANTFVGARHALETLTQLTWFDSMDNTLNIFHDVLIEDSPSFPHRGLMIDTSRNYYPIEQLLKMIDGMAGTKMNVFHWHITDSVSFPAILPSVPNFAKFGAYSQKQVYTPEDIKGLVEYAKERGIRTIIEVDAPSHVHQGWNYADNDTWKLVICPEVDSSNGLLNIDNPEAFQILGNIYKDLLTLGSDNETFHIGNDEVNTACLAQTQVGKNVTDLDLIWINITEKMFHLVKKANGNRMPKNIIMWSSRLTDYLIPEIKNKEYLTVQYWYGQLHGILSNGLKVIFSTVGHWYLDCGYGAWKPGMIHGSCDPYTPWQTFYVYRPWEFYQNNLDQILGGEVCLWSEMVNQDTMEQRIWPRTAAFAERVWSDPQSFDEVDIYHRLALFKERLRAQGIKSEEIWPRFCLQNPGKCYDKPNYFV